MEKLNQELRFLLGPGFSSALLHSNKNIDSSVIEVPALDLHLM